MSIIEDLLEWRTHNPVTIYRYTTNTSQTDAAILMGVSTITMSAWENGRTTPSKDNMVVMAVFMGVTIKKLVSAWDKWVAEKPGV